MDLSLAGKVAVVVGASEGMGRASARAIGREGATVVLLARTKEKLDAATLAMRDEGMDAHGLVADAEDHDDITGVMGTVLERHGRVDALVNAVGGWERGESVLDFDEQSWHRHLDTVVLSALATCRAVIPSMVRAGGGAIVNIGAQSSERHWSAIAAYSAMKAALAHLTKNLAREFGPHGVRVNGIRPGWIMSESQRRIIDARTPDGTSDAEVFAGLLEEWPEICWARRFGTVDEVGDVVAFLVSDRASFVNGALWSVDGGSPV
jgi:3-oxoacyl-[acyl-carrier protein] reductase